MTEPSPDPRLQTKRFDCRFKMLGAPSPEDLERINADFTRRPHSAEEIYTFEIYLANDQPDRDRERFPPEVLLGLAGTLVGKSFLFNHERDSYGRGRFYRAELRTEGEVTWLVGLVYLLRMRQEALIADLEGGIARFVSIGFLADPPIPIKGLPYREYRPPVEALEGSLVWLGAQYEARVASAKALAEAGLLSCAYPGEGCRHRKEEVTPPNEERLSDLLRLETLLGEHGEPGMTSTHKRLVERCVILQTCSPDELELRYRETHRRFALKFPAAVQLGSAGAENVVEPLF